MGAKKDETDMRDNGREKGEERMRRERNRE